MSSTKGPWEQRVKDLILPQVAWYHKCADRPGAGRARLDFIGSTKEGEFFIIEVKEAPERKRTQDWLSWKKNSDSTCISSLQRAEMQDAYVQGVKHIKIAVGIDKVLWIFDFGKMETLCGAIMPWHTAEAEQSFIWTGPKGWKTMEWQWM